MKSPRHPRRWNPWPVSIIAFFTLALIGCGLFVAFCAAHPTDLVAADYYEQEVRYQSQLERMQRARESAAATVAYEPATRTLKVSMPSAQATTAGTIQLYRPSDLSQDRQLALKLDKNGRQIIDASTLLPGLWKVRISWTANHQDCFLDQKVVIGTGT